LPTDITLVPTDGLASGKISRNNGVTAAITVDNAAFEDAHDFLIEARNLEKLVFQIQNTGGSNSLSYEIYGSIDPAVAAPAFSLATWELQVNGAADLANTLSKIFTSASNLIWILVRLKEQTPASDTTALIRTTSGVQ